MVMMMYDVSVARCHLIRVSEWREVCRWVKRDACIRSLNDTMLMLNYYMLRYLLKCAASLQRIVQQVLIELCLNFYNTSPVAGEFVCSIRIFLHWKTSFLGIIITSCILKVKVSADNYLKWSQPAGERTPSWRRFIFTSLVFCDHSLSNVILVDETTVR